MDNIAKVLDALGAHISNLEFTIKLKDLDINKHKARVMELEAKIEEMKKVEWPLDPELGSSINHGNYTTLEVAGQ